MDRTEFANNFTKTTLNRLRTKTKRNGTRNRMRLPIFLMEQDLSGTGNHQTRPRLVPISIFIFNDRLSGRQRIAERVGHPALDPAARN